MDSQSESIWGAWAFKVAELYHALVCTPI